MIYLLRHGQTDWNLFKRANGSTDTYLNKTGLEQAKHQSEQLKNINFDVCFCSPLTRARQYCEIIFKGIPFFDDRLVEIDCGEFEGAEETPKMMESLWQAIQTGDKGTENFNAFINRNCNLCDLIKRDHSGKNILIITHALNARVINYYFIGKPRDYDFTKSVARNNEVVTFRN